MDSVQTIINSISIIPNIGFFLMPLVASVIPIAPEEVFLLVVGYLTKNGQINFWFAYFVFLFGFLITDSIIYFFSYHGAKIIAGLRRRVTKLYIAEDFSPIKKNIKIIIVVSRFIPFIRWIGPFLAGMVKTKYKTFLLYNFFTLILYVPLFLLVGRYFHLRIDRIVNGVNTIGSYIIFGIFIFMFILISIYGRKLFLSFVWHLDNGPKKDK